MRALRHSISSDRTLRAAFALACASAVAVATGVHGAPALVVGGLCSINADGTDSPRERALRLAAVMGSGAAGILLGCSAHSSGPGQIAAMAGTGLAAGALWPRGQAAQLAGLKLMILTCIGFGLGGQVPAGRAVGLYLLGCSPMLLLIAARWAADRFGPRRAVGVAPTVRAARPVPVGQSGRPYGHPYGTGRVRTAAALLRPSAPDARHALRLATCVGLAAAVAVALHPRHASWLPMTTCLVFRLDTMPLHRRALHRAAGTAAGVLIAATLAALAPHGGSLIVVAVVVGALVPALTDWSYAGHTSLATVIVLVLADPAAVAGPAETAARVGDTLLACLVALAFGRLVWPRHRAHPFRLRRGPGS